MPWPAIGYHLPGFIHHDHATFWHSLMILKTFDKDVPPLKIKCPPIFGKANNSFKVQQTQKSFSSTTTSMPLCCAAAMNSSLRCFGVSLRTESINHFPMICCKSECIHTGVLGMSDFKSAFVFASSRFFNR